MNIDDFDSYEAFLTRVNPIIESQAWAIAQACMYLYHTSIDPQDLYVIRNRSGANYSRITCIIRTVT